MLLSSPHPRALARRLAMASALIASGLAAPGCGGGGADDAPKEGQSGLRGHYEAMTQGTPDQLGHHIETMAREFSETNESGPSQARKAQLAYTDAVAQTAAAILEQPGVTAEQGDRAAMIWLMVLRKRLDSFPQKDNLERFLSAADTIAAKFPKTETATRALYAKVDLIDNAPVEALSDFETRVDRLTAAGLALAQAEPPYPEASEALTKIASIAEQFRRLDRARQIYAILAERYAKGDALLAAQGNLRRLEGIGKPVGEVRGPSLDGSGTVDLADYRGKVVLVDFWASYCVPCAKEIPDLQALRDRLGPEGFEVVGVNIDMDLDAAKSFVEKSKPSWPQLAVAAMAQQAEEAAPPASKPGEEAKAADTLGETAPVDPATGANELMSRFGVTYIPLKLLVGRDGTLITTGSSLDLLQPEIDKLFPKGEKPAPEEPKGKGE